MILDGWRWEEEMEGRRSVEVKNITSSSDYNKYLTMTEKR